VLLVREVEEYFAVGAQVTPGAIVLDVGSNIGAFSLRVSERCAGDVRLLCFEPSPATVGALRSNFASHPTLRHTRHSIHHVGLTSKENAQRELAFYDFRRFPTNSTFDLGGKRREFEIFFEDRGRRIGALFRNLLPAGARLLEILSRADDANAILKALPDSSSTPELNIAMQEGEPFALIEELRQHAQFAGAREVITIDGLRVEYADGFGLARPSNTTPVVVLRFEADDARALERIQADFRRVLGEARPGLRLPF
jgi:hypothetical protein